MVRVVYQLLERLPYEPQSHYRMLKQDDVNLLGWDAPTRALASIVEELRSLQWVVLPMIAGADSKSLPDVEPFQGRPGYTVTQSRAHQSLGDMLASIGVQPTVQ